MCLIIYFNNKCLKLSSIHMDFFSYPQAFGICQWERKPVVFQLFPLRLIHFLKVSIKIYGFNPSYYFACMFYLPFAPHRAMVGLVTRTLVRARKIRMLWIFLQFFRQTKRKKKSKFHFTSSYTHTHTHFFLLSCASMLSITSKFYIWTLTMFAMKRFISFLLSSLDGGKFCMSETSHSSCDNAIFILFAPNLTNCLYTFVSFHRTQ